MIKQYDSIADLHADYIARKCRRKSFISINNSWYNNETPEQTQRYTRSGDTSLVSKAEEILESLETNIETERLQWERAPSGAYCVVPDVLAGLPTPMRRQASYTDTKAPINIFASTMSSAGVDSKTLAKRGTVILALVLALMRTRPVRLWQLTCTDGYADRSGETIITAQINTAPLDLATACYVLTSAGFARDITYNLAEKLNDFSGGWPRAFNYRNPSAYYNSLIDRLVPPSEAKNTLIIPGGQLGDRLLKEPLQWVQHYVDRFRKIQNDEEAEFFTANVDID